MKVTQVHEWFWQVAVGAEVVGYVDTVGPFGAERYRVRRLQWPSGRWVAVGEWWEFEEAIRACADVPAERAAGHPNAGRRSVPAADRRKTRGLPPQTRWFGS